MIEVPYAAEVVSDLRGLKQMVERFNPALPLYFDTETTGYEGSDMRSDRPVSLQFHQGETTRILDVRRAGKPGRRQIGSLLLPALQETLLVGHNLKFDLEILLIHFGILPRRVWCTMIAEQVIHGLGLSDGRNQGVGFGLKALAERRGLDVEKETRESFKNMHLTPAWNTPFTPEQIEYMAQDVQVLPAIYASQVETFDLDYSESPDTTKTLWGCFNLEMRVTPALAHIETGGLLVDWDGTCGSEGWMNIIGEKEQEAELLKEQVTLVLGAAIDEVRQRRFEEEWGKYEAWEQARDLALEELKYQWSHFGNQLTIPEGGYKGWGDFKVQMMLKWRVDTPNPGKPKKPQDLPNIGSQQQLLMAFSELGIPAKDTTEGTLEELSEDYPVVAQLMKYRKAVKFVQSFGETLKQKVSAEDGRLRPDFLQIGASSNRMSCKNPNFQQIPSKGDGQRLRKCVVARPGFKILTADFGSQELAIIADVSGDETMLRFFEDGVDLHSATARMMFGLGEDVDPKTFEIYPGVTARTAAKTINYGLAYGLTAYGLAFQLGIPVSAAEELIERWYTPYAGVRRYFDERKRQVFRGPLYSETQHGWRRHYEPLPPEPRKPYYTSSRSQSYDSTAYKEWKEAHRAWEKRKRRLENKLMNTPIQGTGAGITKKALADFFDYVYHLNENEVTPVAQILAVVHDEIVAEVKAEYAVEVAQKLAECMDNAMRHFLPRVNFPKSDVHIGDFWAK